MWEENGAIVRGTNARKLIFFGVHAYYTTGFISGFDSKETFIPNYILMEIGTPILEFIPPLHPVPLSMVTANAYLLKFFPKRCIIRLLLKKSIFCI